MNNSKKQTAKYIFTFSILNGLLLFFLILRYSKYMNLSNSLETVFYLLIAALGNSFLIVFVVSLFLFYPLLLIKWSKKIISVWMILISSAGIALILLDFEVYAQYKIHLNGIIFKMITEAGGEIFRFSWYSWLVVLTILFGVILLEYFISKASQKIVEKNFIKTNQYKIILIVWILALLASNFLHARADVIVYRPILSIARHLPLYYPLTMKRFLTKYKLVDLTKVQKKESFKLEGNKNAVLDYPKHELKFKKQKDSLNIVFIVLDCWRFDMLTKEITPNIYKFSTGENIQKFNNHYSGGNGTRIGLFSLFYGLYGTYWNAISDEQISPVMMDEIIKRNYQVGVFASATLTIPPFNRTIFKNVKILRTESKGHSASERDINALNDWERFISKMKKGQPFFSLLFFDSIHAYDIPKNYPKVFKPYWERVDHVKLNNNFDPLPYKNRYKTSAHFVDSLVGEILNTLSKKKLLKKSVVIITGDHAEEFNENKKNYWGHGGNYTKYQVQVPLILYYPDRARKEYNYWTNHTDVVPTIMENVFSVENPPADYSNGKTLFTDSKRKWMVAGGYFHYAIIEKDYITITYGSGNFEIQDNKANVVDRDINYKILKDVLKETSRFYK